MNYQWNWGVFWDISSTGDGRYLDWLVSGLGWTLATAGLAWIIALVIGCILGVIRTTPVQWAVRLGDAYVELFRNIPLIVHMFLWFFVIPEFLPSKISAMIKLDLPYPEFWTAVFALGLYTAARVSEQVKAGINALPKGQLYAAKAMGFTAPQIYQHVLLPQAFRVIIPPLTSEAANIVKNSSVALTIGLIELTQQARNISEYTFQTFEAFTAATVIYFVVSYSIVNVMRLIERQLRIPGLTVSVSGGGH
jgi:glutamate/aspartate transport system permease protein